MIIAVFDTETTGLLPKNGFSPRTLDKCPHILQLSYIVMDLDRRERLCTRDLYIRIPNEVLIPEESSRIHGITRSIVDAQGIPIREAIPTFFQDVAICDQWVAHNAAFDLTMLRIELMRCIVADSPNNLSWKAYLHRLSTVPCTCTMQSTIDLCQLPMPYNKNQYKYPKLDELHLFLFGTHVDQAHNALQDVLATLRCYLMLEHQWDCLSTSIHPKKRTLHDMQA